MISMRDVDAIKERIACDWWHPQSYKKIIIREKNDHKEEKEKDKKKYVHEIPFVYVTAIHRQSDPVIEWARTNVTMHPGRCPMAKRSHRYGKRDKYDQGRNITLSANLWASLVNQWCILDAGGMSLFILSNF